MNTKTHRNPGGKIGELEDALFKMLSKATDISRELELLCQLKAADPIERLERDVRKMLAEVQGIAGRLGILSRANETIALALSEAQSKESGRLLVQLMAVENELRQGRRKAKKGASRK
jgi:septal ring factor EnvC (AmiA/AmiB activator)